MSLEIDAKALLRILPHRYPFLLVDRVLEVDAGQKIVARKNVTMNEPFFSGHFPGNPIMPGVLQLEMMAQAGGVLLLLIPENSEKLALFAGIEKARFRRPVIPGDSITVEVNILKSRGSVVWMRGEARVDGKVVSEAEMSFALVAREKVEF